MADDDFIVVDDVRHIEIDRYEEVLTDYIGGLRKLPGVRAIYQLGNVRVPGISDIDVIIVVDGDVPAGTDFWGVLSSATGPDGPYIFSHPSYVIGIEEAPNLPALFYADNLKHRWGEIIEFNMFDERQRLFYAYQIALESAIVQSFVFMRSLHNRTATNLRSLVCNLNAIRHNFTTLGQWVDQDDRPHWGNYVSRIDDLRTGWFETDLKLRISEVRALMGVATDLLVEILDELFRIGVKEGYLPESDSENWFSLLDINILLHFSPGEQTGIGRLENPMAWLRRNRMSRRLLSRSPRVTSLFNDVSVLSLPAPLFGLIGACSDDQGRVASGLKQRMLFSGCAMPYPPAAVGDWFAQREAILNRYLIFASDARLNGMLLLTSASWVNMSATLANRVRTAWNRSWVRRLITRGEPRRP